MSAKQPAWVTTEDELAHAVSVIGSYPEYVIDIETDGVNPRTNALSWVGLGTYGEVFLIPMQHRRGRLVREERLTKLGKPSKAQNPPIHKRYFADPGAQLMPDVVTAAIRPLLFNSEQTKIGHNVKFDMLSLAKYYGGKIPNGPFNDTLVMQHVVDENRRSYGLKEIVPDFLRVPKEDRKFFYPKLGKNIASHPIDAVARYLAMDVRYCWLLWQGLCAWIEREGMWDILKLEMDLYPVIMRMEAAGAFVDPVHLDEMEVALDEEIQTIERDAWTAAKVRTPFPLTNTNMKRDLLFKPRSEGGQGLKPLRFTPKQNIPVLDQATLEHYAGNNKLAALFLDYSEKQKLLGTYVLGLRARLHEGKIHTSFTQHATVTGRLSCVAGDTLLPTSRGVFRFDEYLPQEGDLVETHLGKWKPVVRKIYKGLDIMYRVRLSSGDVLHCTLDHRVLTPTGWERVGNLHLGSVVNVCVTDVRERRAEREEGARCIPGSGQADCAGRGQAAGNQLSERAVHRGAAPVTREVAGREGAALLTCQDRTVEPHVGQEWFPAPQLHRGCERRPWVPATQGGWSVLVGARSGDAPGPWFDNTPGGDGGASPRPGQAAQRPGQPGVGDEAGTSVPAQDTARVIEVASLGTMGVWDIEVAEDHSYRAHGFLNHNSRDPNLQNIPRDSNVRALFVAPPGYSLVVADYDQIELRVTAHFSRDERMRAIFDAGEDIHAGTIAAITGRDIGDISKEERQVGKGLNFAVVYGAGPNKVAAMGGVSVEEARFFMKRYYQRFSNIEPWKNYVLNQARRRGDKHHPYLNPPYVTTLLGRKRRLSDLFSYDRESVGRAERQAVNHIVQGTAAEIMKIGMIRVDRAFQGSPFTMVLTVHDEIISLCPEGLEDECQELVVSSLNGITLNERPIIDVPLVVSCGTAKRWSDAK